MLHKHIPLSFPTVRHNPLNFIIVNPAVKLTTAVSSSKNEIFSSVIKIDSALETEYCHPRVSQLALDICALSVCREHRQDDKTSHLLLSTQLIESIEMLARSAFYLDAVWFVKNHGKLNRLVRDSENIIGKNRAEKLLDDIIFTVRQIREITERQKIRSETSLTTFPDNGYSRKEERENILKNYLSSTELTFNKLISDNQKVISYMNECERFNRAVACYKKQKMLSKTPKISTVAPNEIAMELLLDCSF